MIRNLGTHATGALFAFIGVVAISFDGLLVRLADTTAPDILFWRGLFMAITLTVVLRLLNGRWTWACMRRGGVDAWWTAAGFATTNYLFVLAVLHTTVANAVVILATSPLFAALFSGLILREWIPLRTWVAILVSLAGIFGVFAGSLETGGWLGDLFALGAAMVVGLKLTLLRRSPQIDRLAVIAAGGLMGAAVAVFFATPLAVSATGLATLLLMGVVQLPLALVMIALATRYLPAGEVALFLVLEAVLGTLWVWLLLAEAPATVTLIAGTAVLVTLALHALASWRDEQR